MEWVYFILNKIENTIKIGRSYGGANGVMGRINVPAHYVRDIDNLVILGIATSASETYIHKKFDNQRLHHELFQDCSEIREFVELNTAVCNLSANSPELKIFLEKLEKKNPIICSSEIQRTRAKAREKIIKQQNVDKPKIEYLKTNSSIFVKVPEFIYEFDNAIKNMDGWFSFEKGCYKIAKSKKNLEKILIIVDRYYKTDYYNDYEKLSKQ